METTTHERREENNGLFPEVTFAYINLDKTTQNCWQQLHEEIEPLVSSVVNDKFIPLLEYVADRQGTQKGHYIFLRETQGYSQKVGLLGQDSTLVVPTYRKYIYWGNPEVGVEEFETTPVYPETVPESGKFRGFEEAREYGRYLHSIKANLPNPSPPYNGVFWESEFYPVFKNYSDILNILKPDYSQVTRFNELLKKYEDAANEIEKQTVELEEKLAPQIRSRIFQLVDSIGRLPLGKLLYLPRYACFPCLDLREDKNLDVFFLPKEKRLVRAPLKLPEKPRRAKPDLKNASENPLEWMSASTWKFFGANPNLKKSTEAEPADWFRVGERVKRGLVEKLKKPGWEMPLRS